MRATTYTPRRVAASSVAPALVLSPADLMALRTTLAEAARQLETGSAELGPLAPVYLAGDMRRAGRAVNEVLNRLNTSTARAHAGVRP